MEAGTENEYKARYGDNWREILEEDERRSQERKRIDEVRERKRQDVLARCYNEKLYDQDWSKGLRAGRFKGERY